MMKRLLALSAVTLLSACANNNLTPPAELVDFNERASFDRVWSADIGDLRPDLRFELVPASDGENVYVADHEGAVYAFRLADGDKLWEYDTSEFHFFGDSTAIEFSAGPAVADGRVVVGSRDGQVLALDAATGEVLWQESLKGELLAPPLMVAGLVIVRAIDGRVIALDAASGATRWETVRDVPKLTVRGLSPLLNDGGQIYAGFDNGKVAALSVQDGRMIWEATIATPGGASELQEIVDVDGELALFGSELYATSYNGNLAALAIESGEVLWRNALSSVESPTVAWGNVYAVDVDSVIHAYDRLSGATVWTQDALLRRDLASPVVFGELLAVGDFEGYLHFLDLGSGEMIARISHGGEPVRARPLVVGDLLVVLSDDGELAAYRREAAREGVDSE